MMVDQRNWIKSHSGVPMPPIIYGTAWKKEKTDQFVTQALEQGFRGIDTACQPKHYHEPGVGQALKRFLGKNLRREQIFIQTKFTPLPGHDPQQIPYDPKAPLAEQVLQSFRQSQTNIGVEQIDSLVLHSPLERFDDLLEVWQSMEHLHDQGMVRQLGISNCYDLGIFRKLFSSARVKPAVLQNRFYKESDYDHHLRQFCHDHQIVYQSFWTLTANPHILAHPTLHSIGERHGFTVAQTLFRYLSQKGVIPLTGTTSLEHMQQDLAIFAKDLHHEELAAIDRLLAE